MEISHASAIKVKDKSPLVVPLLHFIIGVLVFPLLQNEVDGWVQLSCPSPLYCSQCQYYFLRWITSNFESVLLGRGHPFTVHHVPCNPSAGHLIIIFVDAPNAQHAKNAGLRNMQNITHV